MGKKDDLISRTKLLEDFRNTITQNSDTFDWLNMIARQKQINVDDLWIPIEERLPQSIDDSYQMNLVTLKNGEVCLGVYRNEEKEWLTRMQEGEDWYTNRHTVIAWMPLPEPYIQKTNWKDRFFQKFNRIY